MWDVFEGLLLYIHNTKLSLIIYTNNWGKMEVIRMCQAAPSLVCCSASQTFIIIC